jgi:transcriptional regulator with XRE-family HTH domain
MLLESPPRSIGTLIRQWRERRRMSQLSLAIEAEVSSRHLSFVETGRSHPSREMVLLLAEVLDVPPRARNDLLAAAGYAPIYRESDLDAPEMAQFRQALDFMLRQQEPYPAIVLDRYWNVLLANEGTERFMGLFLDAEAEAAADLGSPNAMRLICHPQALRPSIVNWEATAAALIQWLHRDLLRSADPGTQLLLDELLAYPDVPRNWRTLDLDAPTAPFLTIEMQKGDVHLKFFTTLTTLGTPYDITLHELRIESFFPADDATDTTLRRLSVVGVP